MGTTADKLTYLNTTKGKIKESINLTGANLTNETFRQYATVLKDTLAHILKNPSPIWDNFPKTTATGSAIQVNTYNSLLDYSLDGNTTQNGTPTPTSPIPISNVSGLQEVDVVGKNFLNKSSTPIYYSNNMQYIETDTGCKLKTSSNNTSGFVLIDLGNIKEYENKTLTFSMSNTPNALYKYIAFVGCDDTGGNRTTIGNALGNSANTLTTTIGSGYTQTRLTIRLYIEGGTASTEYELNNIQVEKGNSSTTYEPYKGKTYDINLGKNLFDGIIEQGNYDGSTGAKTGSNAFYRNANKIPVQPNTTYTFSLNGVSQRYVVLFYKGDGTFISQNSSLTTGTFTTPNNAYYVNFRCFQSDYTDDYATLKVQLERGSVATSYSPYFTPIELNKISTYKDFIFKGKGINLFDGVFRQGSEGTTAVNNYCFSNNDLVLSSGTYTLVNTLPSGFDYAIFGTTNPFPNTQTKTYNSGWRTGTTTFTINQDLHIGILVRKGGNNFTPSDISSYTFMIYKGTYDSSLPYEPYNAKDKWLLHKEIGKYNEWSSVNRTTTMTNTTFYQFVLPIPTDSSKRTYTISNYFQNQINNYDVEHLFIGTNEPNVYAGLNVFISNSRVSTSAEAITWLKNNGVEVYYVLNTPTTTEITNSELLEDLDSIELLDGLNNIMINGDLSAIMNLTCLEKE